MTADSLLKALGSVGVVTKVFAFPYVQVYVSSPRFSPLSELEREAELAMALGITIDELRRTANNCLLLVRPVGPEDSPTTSLGRSTHWLAGLTDAPAPHENSTVRAVHFYGYKGGQARSTVLAETAISLANDGWRVLVVDADIEAPSLDTLFSASSSSLGGTLLGVSQGVPVLRPITVFSQDVGNRGIVDLFNCWPKGAGYTIDATAFALRSALDPSLLERAFDRIKDFAQSGTYDVVLVDHRTGVSSTSLPIMKTLPGSTVIAIRLDEQWRPAARFLDLVMRFSYPDPGLFVVWKPDSEESRSFGQRTFRQREDLLEILAATFGAPGAEEESILTASDIEDHLVVWPYDSAFRSQRLPEPVTLDAANQDALSQIRSLLRLGHKFPTEKQVGFNISGAKDRGDLIITRALRELLSPANPYTYILGRKGTGKTRLARELSASSQGEPLLVANDSEDTRGIRAGAPELIDATEQCRNRPERFWLALFDAGVQGASTERESLVARFRSSLDAETPASDIISIWQQQGKQRVFLLDSLETTFPSRHMATFLDSLFRVLSMIEGEPRIADQIRFRLFLRRDLAQPGFVQNIEQKLYGKSLELSWDYQSILNFMLSRMHQNPWYAEHFGALDKALSANRETIREGKLHTLECEQLLLMAFPSNVKRNNLSTVTFLRTYFADSASDRGPADTPSTDDVRRYYPRVFDDFLSEIPGELTDENGVSLPLLENGRISQQRIFRAHENATNNYLSGLKQELAYLVNLAADLGENQTQLEKLLNAFDGLRTPFKLDVRVGEISKVTGIASESVRSALEKMKDVGMFEFRPDYPGEWRAGRLFKSSLRMKYGRGRAAAD